MKYAVGSPLFRYNRYVMLSLHAGNRQSGHYNADHGHEFNEDIEARSGRVLKGIAYCVAHDGGLVTVRTLATKVTFFHHFLRVVPRATGIGHEDSKCKACRKTTHQEA